MWVLGRSDAVKVYAKKWKQKAKSISLSCWKWNHILPGIECNERWWFGINSLISLFYYTYNKIYTYSLPTFFHCICICSVICSTYFHFVLSTLLPLFNYSFSKIPLPTIILQPKKGKSKRLQCHTTRVNILCCYSLSGGPSQPKSGNKLWGFDSCST